MDLVNSVYEELQKTKNINKICKKLSISKDDIKLILKELKKAGKVCQDRRGDYCIIRQGIITINPRGFGFIQIAEGIPDVFVGENDLLGAFEGDLVNFYTYNDREGKIAGEVVKIVKRAHEYMIGELVLDNYFDNPRYFIESHDKKFNERARVKLNGLNGAIPGSIVMADIHYKLNGVLEATITKVLGNKDDPGIEISEIALTYGFEAEFSPKAVKEAEALPYDPSQEDILMDGRVDYTNDLAITIDGDDSKDFDDAVYLTQTDDGNYLLRVYIADVSHYVTPGSGLDEEAYNRSTSVYLADRVIPMIPHKLSNGICSLNEGVPRLVLVCSMEIDLKGNLKNYEITEGVIKSKHRMTYNNVNKMLDGDASVIEQYSDIYPMIMQMQELSHIIRKRRLAKGGLEFEVAEYKFSLNEDGSPKDIKLRTRADAEMLIEDFMLEANETVAYNMSIMDLPCCYRVHEKPDQDKLRNVFQLVKNLGVDVKIGKNDIHPKQIQETLNNITDETTKFIANQMLLRSMMKAKYTTKNLGHYGLAMNYYCHFTSPIRRYPDLMVHRLIKQTLLHPSNLENTLAYYDANLENICIHTSTQERKAIDCERDVDDMLFAWYMESHINERHDGMITSVTPFGMFVTLSNGVEGLVHIKNMKGFFNYNEEQLCLSNGIKTFKLGDKVEIVVIGANRKDGQIDFVLNEDYNIPEVEE